MAGNIDTRNLDTLSGAVFFSMGRGTEGGSASYRLSVAGVRDSRWGEVGDVAENSGYSIGSIQVDLGQRGEWAVGAIDGHRPGPGEKSYVDAIIEQSSAYARANNLPFTQDLDQLRAELLTHGNGKNGRSSVTFIDEQTRSSINAWGASQQGKQWIHANVDYPQARNATAIGMSMVDTYGTGITEDRRFEAINIIAKTANQYPGHLPKLRKVLEEGGDYDALLARAVEIKGAGAYDGPKAGRVAERYENAYNDPANTAAMDRAHAKVARRDYDPSTEATDPDLQVANAALGRRARASAMSDGVLEVGERGSEVKQLQTNLQGLGFTDASGTALKPDDSFGTRTQEAVTAAQRAHGVDPANGKADAKTLAAIDTAVKAVQADLKTLGITDAKGRDLAVDGDWGRSTAEGVKSFQTQNKLPETGIADAATREALAKQAAEKRQAADPRSQSETAPQPAGAFNGKHPLLDQAMVQLEKRGPNGGFADRSEMERVAAVLALESQRGGMSRIDRIVESTDGKGIIALQVNPKNPYDVHREYVDKAHASAQPLEQTRQQLESQESLREYGHNVLRQAYAEQREPAALSR